MAEATIDGDLDGVGPVRIALFGPVTIHVGSTPLTPSGLPAQLLALLALHRGEWLSAERLLDVLWPEAPDSGLNALQRHVSAIRRLVRDAGAPALAAALIDHHDRRYRLAPETVTTDVDALADSSHGLVSPRDTGIELRSGVRWWLEPLSGLPHEIFAPHRVALDSHAAAAAHRWLADEPPASDVVTALASLTERHPHDDELWVAYRRALAPSQRPVEADGVVSPVVAPRPDQADGLAGVSEPLIHLLDDDLEGARAALERGRAAMTPDTARRLDRWVAGLDLTDGLLRSLLGALLAELSVNTVEAERTLIATDTFVLLDRPRGIELARKEAADALGPVERTRCQRVLAFALMGSPLSEGFEEAVAELAALDDPHAQAEAARLSLSAWFSRGEFERVIAELEPAQRQIDAIAPDQAWVGAVIRSALHEYEPTRHLVPHLSAQDRYLRSGNDQIMLDTITLWHRLDRRQLGGVTAAQLRHVATKVTHLAALALEVKYLIALGRIEDAETRIRPYRRGLASLPRHNWLHPFYAVVAEVALALRDGGLAAEVAAALEPWAGEYLGNYEIILGPTDELLTSLRRCADGL